MTLAAQPPLLIVEDSDEDFETLRWAFAKLGMVHPVRRCVTGDDALEFLRRSRYAGNVRPALILLDLNLPGMDGREVLSEVKSDAVLRSIPVIVLTTSSNPKDVLESYTAGANAYMIEPVNLEKLTANLRAFCDFWLNAAALPEVNE